MVINLLNDNANKNITIKMHLKYCYLLENTAYWLWLFFKHKNYNQQRSFQECLQIPHYCGQLGQDNNTVVQSQTVPISLMSWGTTWLILNSKCIIINVVLYWRTLTLPPQPPSAKVNNCHCSVLFSTFTLQPQRRMDQKINQTSGGNCDLGWNLALILRGTCP